MLRNRSQGRKPWATNPLYSFIWVVLNYFVDQADGTIDWPGYFDDRMKNGDGPSSDLARDRQEMTGLQYDTELMLQQVVNDVRELHYRGWPLPYGLEESDLDEMEALAQSGKERRNGEE